MKQHSTARVNAGWLCRIIPTQRCRRHASGALRRKAVDAGGNGGERRCWSAPAARRGQCEGAIAGCEQAHLRHAGRRPRPVRRHGSHAAPPIGSRAVIFALPVSQPPSVSHSALSLGPAARKDSAAHAAVPPSSSAVRGIDDGIDIERRDVADQKIDMAPPASMVRRGVDMGSNIARHASALARVKLAQSRAVTCSREHPTSCEALRKTWMAGSSPAMTKWPTPPSLSPDRRWSVSPMSSKC